MRACPHCDGFVPDSLTSCPHCDRPALSLRGRLLTGALASGAAMTLMACYGAPLCDDDGDFDCIQPDTADSVDTGESGDGGESCDETETATAIVLEGELPLSQSGQLQAELGSNAGSCGGAGDELAYHWTPATTGSYRFSVDASGLDMVLYLRAGEVSSCGEELACADDFGAGVDEALTVNLEGGVPVTVVVDSASAALGSFTLMIEAAP